MYHFPEYNWQAYLLFIIAKDMLSRQLSYALESESSLKIIFDNSAVKHSLYHMWDNHLCCDCQSPPDPCVPKLIADEGWATIYGIRSDTHDCPSGYIQCSCKYTAKDVKKEDIGIATWLYVVQRVGNLNGNGRRCLKELQECCSVFFQTPIDKRRYTI